MKVDDIMNKKGFTLVELLITFVIIGIISGLGVFAYNSIFGLATDEYYITIENSMLFAGNEYFSDHRSERPTLNETREVSLSTLVERKYLDPVKDSNGNVCNNGKVYIYRENNKYNYVACLVDCGGYNSHGKFCDE